MFALVLWGLLSVPCKIPVVCFATDEKSSHEMLYPIQNNIHTLIA